MLGNLQNLRPQPPRHGLAQIQTGAEGPWRPLKAPADPCRPLEAPGGPWWSWRPLEAPGGPWVLLCSCLKQALTRNYLGGSLCLTAGGSVEEGPVSMASWATSTRFAGRRMCPALRRQTPQTLNPKPRAQSLETESLNHNSKPLTDESLGLLNPHLPLS